MIFIFIFSSARLQVIVQKPSGTLGVKEIRRLCASVLLVNSGSFTQARLAKLSAKSGARGIQCKCF